MISENVNSAEITLSKNGESNVQEANLKSKDKETQTIIISTQSVASETKPEEGSIIEWNLATYKVQNYQLMNI